MPKQGPVPYRLTHCGTVGFNTGPYRAASQRFQAGYTGWQVDSLRVPRIGCLIDDWARHAGMKDDAERYGSGLTSGWLTPRRWLLGRIGSFSLTVFPLREWCWIWLWPGAVHCRIAHASAECRARPTVRCRPPRRDHLRQGLASGKLDVVAVTRRMLWCVLEGSRQMRSSRTWRTVRTTESNTRCTALPEHSLPNAADVTRQRATAIAAPRLPNKATPPTAS